MYYVGIDIGKEIHEAGDIDEQGVPLGRSIRFSNTLNDYQRSIQIAMEATSHYWLLLYDFLKVRGYEATVIQTEAHRRGKIRRTRTDKRDSYRHEDGNVQPYQPKDT